MAIASALRPGKDFFIQSDVREVIDPMVALTELSACFDRPEADETPWRSTNPLSVPTERERYVMDQQLPVYRVLFRRNHTNQPPLDALEKRWQEIDNPSNAPTPEA
jgi:tRNA (guanine-N7-)-methyltransferase